MVRSVRNLPYGFGIVLMVFGCAVGGWFLLTYLASGIEIFLESPIGIKPGRQNPPNHLLFGGLLMLLFGAALRKIGDLWRKD
jgi:hypothetical protein